MKLITGIYSSVDPWGGRTWSAYKIMLIKEHMGAHRFPSPWETAVQITSHIMRTTLIVYYTRTR